jgi:hypothetical protein
VNAVVSLKKLQQQVGRYIRHMLENIAVATIGHIYEQPFISQAHGAFQISSIFRPSEDKLNSFCVKKKK